MENATFLVSPSSHSATNSVMSIHLEVGKYGRRLKGAAGEAKIHHRRPAEVFRIVWSKHFVDLRIPEGPSDYCPQAVHLPIQASYAGSRTVFFWLVLILRPPHSPISDSSTHRLETSTAQSLK